MMHVAKWIKVSSLTAAVLLLAGAAASAGIVPWVVSFTGDTWATQYQGGRKMVQDSTGIYHAVYQAWVNNAAAVEYVYSLNTQGTQWSAPMAIPQASPGFIPAISIDRNDILHVVWSNNADICYSFCPAVPPGGPWLAPPVNVSNNPMTGSCMCSIDCDSANAIHVVWQEIDFTPPLADEILYSTAPAPGGPFSPAFNVSSNINESERPCVACPQDWSPGSVHVVWDEIGAGWPSFHVFHRALTGGGWTAAAQVDMLGPAPGQSDIQGLGACVAVDGADNPHVVYSHWTLPPLGVWYSPGVFAAGAFSFTASVQIGATVSTYDVPNPTISLDKNGIIRVLFTDDAASPPPPPPPKQRTLFYTFYDPGFGAWRAPTSFSTLDYNCASYAYKNQMFGGHAVWTDGDAVNTNLQAAWVPPVFLKLTGTPASAPRGSTMTWTIHLNNATTFNQPVELWIEVSAPIPPAPKALLYKTLPNYKPGLRSGAMKQKIPAGVPVGTYFFTVTAAWTPANEIWDSDSFQVNIY